MFSTVLGTGDATANRTAPNEEQLAKCGVHYCPWTGLASSEEDEVDEDDANENFKVPRVRVNLLSAIFVVCALAAPVVVTLLVNPLSR